jgi:hypothetical protein
MIGNIIAFKGFVNQFSTETNSSGTPILAADVLSAWNAVGSVMQWWCVHLIMLPFAGPTNSSVA